jgi:NTP pyrophosphatase (non-canonical NTP hydrolase)
MKTFEDYQSWRRGLAFYPQAGEFEGLVYAILALGGEAGEAQNDLKKIIRDYQGIVVPETREKLLFELGDVLWYIDAAATELGSNLQEVAEMNIQKLEKRHQDGSKAG